MKKLLSPLCLLGTLFLLAGGPAPEKRYYVEVPFTGPEGLRSLVEQGYDVGGVNLEKSTATLVVAERDLNRARGLRALSTRPILAPDEQYKKPEDVEQALKNAEKNFPDLAKVESIGQSVEGRDIWAIHLTAFKVPAADGGEKPAVLFDAMHHAREVMTSEVALDIVDYLTTNYASDASVKKWMDRYNIWVIPMNNPDGNSKVWGHNSMWRKNTQGGYGVDINRNYPYAWNTCNGSSGNKGADDYRGESAGSEPETQAIMALTERIKPVFDISYHSFSQIVIYPYGCSGHHIPSEDKEVYEGIGRELASKLVTDSGSGHYRAGTSYELLYNVDGGSIDWMYDATKTMAFVIEMNGDSLGFQPSYDKWRDKTVERQRAGWQFILDRMEGPGIRRASH